MTQSLFVPAKARLVKFRTSILRLSAVVALLCTSLFAEAQIPGNTSKSLVNPSLWKTNELIQPAELASLLKSGKAKKFVILNIGVVDDIEGAINIGAAEKKEKLEKLHNTLNSLPKNSHVVIYCGCCPFEKCPNIRPAFKMMKKMGFSNGKLLNLPVNLKQNWINKGYPMASNKNAGAATK